MKLYYKKFQVDYMQESFRGDKKGEIPLVLKIHLSGYHIVYTVYMIAVKVGTF